jgi:hypothetical protein
MKELTFLLICSGLFSGCSFTRGNGHPSEIEMLSNDVLKKGQGVQIEIRPLPKDK